MTDANTLEHKAPDAIDYSKYDTGEKKGGGAGGRIVALPPKGRHQFQTIEVACNNDTRTKAGYLKATIKVKTVEPGQPWDGHEIRFVDLSTKKYTNREANQLADYLRACGIAQQPQTDAEYIALANATMNRTFEAGVNWVAKDPDTRDEVVKDMDAFPIVDGKRLQYLTKENDPQNRKMWANAKLTYYVSKVATPSA